MDTTSQLLEDQAGLISRRQALDSAMSVVQIARLVRRREWVAVHEGVYVEHTGPLTWLQRAWAAVLFSWPAALSHESSVRAGEGPGRAKVDDSVIHVEVGRRRHLVAPPGVRIHRASRFEGRVLWNLGPPRVRLEEALLDLAVAAPRDLDAIARLADACGSRRTTARRLIDTLATRSRAHRRDWLSSVLLDVAEGTCSVLEHGYLTRVEHAHGLPVGQRQARRVLGDRLMFQDVAYEEQGLVVELDGRLFHDSAGARDRDLDRDLDVAVDGGETVRLGWGQVVERPCRTAGRVAAVLQRRGWAGELMECSECG